MRNAGTLLRSLELRKGRSNSQRVRAGGIEPPSIAWEAIILPLNYARVYEMFNV